MGAELPRLVTDRYELRLAEVSDVPQLLSYRRDNAEHFRPFEPVPAADHYTDAFWVRQVERDHEEFEAGLSVRFYMFEPGPGAAVLGLASFSNIVRGPFQSCFLGYALDQGQQGRGLMTGAIRLSIEYMFGEMNLHRISANYVPHNTRSAAVLKRLGFALDGYARDYLMIEGRWQDHILTSLINPDWTPPAG